MYAAVRGAIQDSVNGKSIVLIHISHSYKAGASLYFSYIFEMDTGAESEQWKRIKQSASNAIRDFDGTISHHHGVGIDHRAWMDAEKGTLGMSVLKATKDTLDPSGMMNPGKLLSGD